MQVKVICVSKTLACQLRLIIPISREKKALSLFPKSLMEKKRNKEKKIRSCLTPKGGKKIEEEIMN